MLVRVSTWTMHSAFSWESGEHASTNACVWPRELMKDPREASAPHTCGILWHRLCVGCPPCLWYCTDPQKMEHFGTHDARYASCLPRLFFVTRLRHGQNYADGCFVHWGSDPFVPCGWEKSNMMEIAWKSLNNTSSVDWIVLTSWLNTFDIQFEPQLCQTWRASSALFYTWEWQSHVSAPSHHFETPAISCKCFDSSTIYICICTVLR